MQKCRYTDRSRTRDTGLNNVSTIMQVSECTGDTDLMIVPMDTFSTYFIDWTRQCPPGTMFPEKLIA